MRGTADGGGRVTDTVAGPAPDRAGGPDGRAADLRAPAPPGRPAERSPVAALVPLLLDVGVPVGGYYLLRDGFGVSLVAALALSGVVPAVRTARSALRDRSFNGPAGLMLVVNVVGIALSFVAGDPRLMIVKDSGTSSVVGVAILVSLFRGTPTVSAGLKPMLAKGRAEQAAAWDRLAVEGSEFRRLERVFGVVWGTVLLAECAARIVGAYALRWTRWSAWARCC